jgi:hypothetical protein
MSKHLREKSLQELRRMASGLRIEGRSKMGKEDLIKNVRKKMRGGSAPQNIFQRNLKKYPAYLVYGTEIVKAILQIREVADGKIEIRTKEGIKTILQDEMVIYGNYVAVRSNV